MSSWVCVSVFAGVWINAKEFHFSNIDDDCFHLIVLFVSVVQEAFQEIIRLLCVFSCYRFCLFSWICSQVENSDIHVFACCTLFSHFEMIQRELLSYIQTQKSVHISQRLEMKNVTIEVENYALLASDSVHFSLHSYSESPRWLTANTKRKAEFKTMEHVLFVTNLNV